MKNLKITLLAAVIFGFAFSNLQNANAQNVLEGVEINGVTWATTNVGATAPGDYGNLFSWQEAQTACPKGWRLPTMKELEMFENYNWVKEEVIDARVPSVWANSDGKNGRCFTDKVTKNSIFLPAAGYINTNGMPYNTGIYGFYWSSTEHGRYNANFLCFYHGNAYLYLNLKDSGHSVRCVAE